MGIVVTIFMHWILLLSIPNLIKTRLQKHQTKLASITLLAGLWNAFWCGMQHLGEFWGNAAFVSGLLMIFTSVLLLTNWSFAKKLNRVLPRFVRIIALIALAGYAILYTYTLVLLNLE